MRALVLLLGTTLASGAVWKPLGPFGGSAEAIAVHPAHPDIIVTTTKNGLVYRSTDKGESWSAAAFPLAGQASVHALTVSSDKEPIFYLGLTGPSGESGLYRSIDGAVTWTPLPAFVGRPVYSISIWKRDPRVIAAGSSDGAYVSADRGLSWRRISRRTDQPITALAIDPLTSDVVYAGTSHLAWKTSDGGQNWAPIQHGMLDDSDIFSFDIDPTDPRRVFSSSCSGVYRSGNGGAQWSRISMIPDSARRMYLVRIHPADPKIVFAASNTGLWRSRDDGSTWQKILDRKVKSIAFDPSAASSIYLATDGAGLLVSHDLGSTTRPIGAGFVSRNVWSIPGAATTIYTTDGEILAVRADAEQWIPVQPPAGERRMLSGILDIAPDKLLIYTRTALFRSSGVGSAWTKLPAVSGSSQLRFLKVVNGEVPSVLAATSEGLYITENLGESWTATLGGPIDSLFTGAASRGRVVARSGSRLLLSKDVGRTWTAIEHPVRDGEIYDLDLDSDGAILAATARGLFRSADSGRTWSRPDGPLGMSTVKCVRFHPRQGVAFALQGSEIQLSTDSGVSWTRVESAGVDLASVRSIEVSAHAPDRVFALTHAKGVFVSNFSTIVTRREAADRK